MMIDSTRGRDAGSRTTPSAAAAMDYARASAAVCFGALFLETIGTLMIRTAGLVFARSLTTLAGALLLSLTGVPDTAVAGQTGASAGPSKGDVLRAVLPNGLRVIIVRNA